MPDVFYEETALCANISSEKRKYFIFKALFILFIVLAVLWFLIIFLSYDFSTISQGSLILNILFLIFPILSCVGLSVLSYKMKNKYCLDYDYVFISGSVRLSKVINNVKRRNLYKFETYNIEKIGKFGSDTFNSYDKQPNVKTVVLTSNPTPAEGKSFFYLAVNGVDQKKLILVLECTDLFIKNIMKFAKSYILEKDFK